MARFDLAVVGAGIVGLAHALAGARRGLRVAVLERDPHAGGASIRNFGFVTVTGQAAGEARRRSLRSRDVWAEIAPQAGIEVLQRGAIVVAERPEALAVLSELAAGPLGEDCALLDAAEARRRLPALAATVAGALWSPHELRVEPREAIARLARWLAERHGVTFRWGTAALGIEEGGVRHAGGGIEAGAVVLAPGSEVAALAPEAARRAGLSQCALQMVRTRAQPASWRLPAVLMSDLSLVRYEAFAAQPSAGRLRECLARENPAALAHGVHLIVAQSADGSLVVGDSHRYGPSADPFASAEVEALIIAEMQRLLAPPAPEIAERWVGAYPVAEAGTLVAEPLGARSRLVAVTGGTGMSMAFAIAEETIAELFG